MAIDVVQLTRRLVDIESITGAEGPIGIFLRDLLSETLGPYGAEVTTMPVSGDRFNVVATFGRPIVTFSTHMDTVGPFISAHVTDQYVHGRGACDAKGIMASMIVASEQLALQGIRETAMLLVVGEESGSDGAREASLHPNGSSFIINGEPTDNRMVSASKGVLRYRIAARGEPAHSAYPEQGASAIATILDALERVRSLDLPKSSILGETTLNIGRISGGVAHNVIAESAVAELSFRTVEPSRALREAVEEALGNDVEVHEIIDLPVMNYFTLAGYPSTAVSFSTDVPILAGSWGTVPILVGPGSISLAHSSEERVRRSDLVQAVTAYEKLVRRLLDKAIKGR